MRGDKMDVKEMDRMIKEAKLWLQQNRPPEKSEKSFWVDGNEVVHECPPGTFFDYQTGRFVKKGR